MINIKQHIENFIEKVWNQRQIELTDDYFSVDQSTYSNHATIQGIAALKNFISAKQKQFPDIKMTILEIISSSQQAVLHWQSNYHENQKKYSYNGISLFHFDKDKITQTWVYSEAPQMTESKL